MAKWHPPQYEKLWERICSRPEEVAIHPDEDHELAQCMELAVSTKQYRYFHRVAMAEYVRRINAPGFAEAAEARAKARVKANAEIEAEKERYWAETRESCTSDVDREIVEFVFRMFARYAALSWEEDNARQAIQEVRDIEDAVSRGITATSHRKMKQQARMAEGRKNRRLAGPHYPARALTIPMGDVS